VLDGKEDDTMIRALFLFVTALALLFVVSGSGAASDLPVREILKHADQSRGNLGGIIWDIVITTNEGGRSETRGLTVKVKGSNTLAKYTSPANMNDRMVLVVDRNMWFIRSGLSKPVSISPRQKLLGDAANGDIASTNYVEDYEGKLVGEESVQGELCYVLDLKAANRNVTYDRIKYWVSKERLVGVKADFYSISGKLFKTAEFKYGNRIRLDEKTEIPFISELLIRDAIQLDKVTSLRYSNVKVSLIPDSAFNLNILLR
jgi:outer membrane lipoprotein-sorting protein